MGVWAAKGVNSRLLVPACHCLPLFACVCPYLPYLPHTCPYLNLLANDCPWLPLLRLCEHLFWDICFRISKTGGKLSHWLNFSTSRRSEHMFRDIRFRISKTESIFDIDSFSKALQDIEEIGDIEQLKECQSFRISRGLHRRLTKTLFHPCPCPTMFQPAPIGFPPNGYKCIWIT